MNTIATIEVQSTATFQIRHATAQEIRDYHWPAHQCVAINSAGEFVAHASTLEKLRAKLHQSYLAYPHFDTTEAKVI